MSKIIAVANQKGGVGKTSLCFHIGGCLAGEGKNVLLVDLDQQGNLSSIFVPNIYKLEYTVATIFLDEEFDIADSVIKSDIPNLSVIPSNLDLSNVDVQLAADPEAQYLLSEKIDKIRDQYDYIFIDCPPSLGLATRGGLVAADDYIIPLEAAEWATRGSSHLMSAVKKIMKRANRNLNFLGYIINRFDGRRRLEQDYLDSLREVFKDKIFKSVIKDSVKYSQSITEKKLPITMYMPTSEYAEAIRSLTKEITNHAKAK